MTRLRPHQKPILTRFAFVMPMTQVTSDAMFDHVVPCEPSEAKSFVVFKWDVPSMSWVVHEPHEDYEAAREAAHKLDAELAKKWGVPR